MGLIKSKLKRRLRKKYHLGEFREFGFEVAIEFENNLSEKLFDKFYDEFIEEIENLELLFGGGGCPLNVNGFICSAKKYSSPSSAKKESLGSFAEP